MGYLREHWAYLTESGKFPGVDGLRAFAVVLVLMYHFQFLAVGWVGVDLFFVISGFLIGGMIVDRILADRFSMKEFYVRRALRILPAYYFAILVCAVFKADSPLDVVAIRSILAGMLFLQTSGPYFLPDIFRLNESYLVDGGWSLAIEEIFYLVAPLTLILFTKISRKNILGICALVGLAAASGVASRLYMTSAFAPDDVDLHFASFIQFHSRYDELALGILAALLIRIVPGIRAHSALWLLVGLALTGIFLAYIYSHPGYLAKSYTIGRDTIWLPTLLGAAGMSLLLGTLWWDIRAKAIVVLARISYPLYLVHILVLNLTAPYGGEGVLLWMLRTFTWDGRAIILMAVSIVLAYLVSLCVEYPFVRLYKGRGANPDTPEPTMKLARES